MTGLLSTAREAYERFLHQLGLHGQDSAILLPVFSLACFLAGYFVMTMVLQAMGLPRVKRAGSEPAEAGSGSCQTATAAAPGTRSRPARP